MFSSSWSKFELETDSSCWLVSTVDSIVRLILFIDREIEAEGEALDRLSCSWTFLLVDDAEDVDDVEEDDDEEDDVDDATTADDSDSVSSVSTIADRTLVLANLSEVLDETFNEFGRIWRVLKIKFEFLIKSLNIEDKVDKGLCGKGFIPVQNVIIVYCDGKTALNSGDGKRTETLLFFAYGQILLDWVEVNERLLAVFKRPWK